MKSPVWFCVKYQLSVLAMVGLVLAQIDYLIARSFILGAIIYVVPNAYFVHYAFRYSGAENAPMIVRSFSAGESGKFALTCVGFILVYRLVDVVHSPALFAGLCSMVVLQWFVAARMIAVRDQSKIDNK